MFDIIQKVDNLLSNILTPLNISFSAEEYTSVGEELPQEYVVYQKIDGYGREFADNSAKEIMHYIRVNYYTQDPTQKAKMMESIKTAMMNAGFYYPTNDSIPIPRDVDASFWGVYSDFFYMQGAGEVWPAE